MMKTQGRGIHYLTMDVTHAPPPPPPPPHSLSFVSRVLVDLDTNRLITISMSILLSDCHDVAINILPEIRIV